MSKQCPLCCGPMDWPRDYPCRPAGVDDAIGEVETFGVVAVTRGKYAGRLGYFDDGDYERASVCFGMPLRSPVVDIPYRWLRPATLDECRRYEAFANAQCEEYRLHRSALISLLRREHHGEVHMNGRWLDEDKDRELSICWDGDVLKLAVR